MTDLADAVAAHADAPVVTALANRRPDLFLAHARWAAGFLARRERLAHLDEALAALDDALGRAERADTEAGRALRRDARAALDEAG